MIVQQPVSNARVFVGANPTFSVRAIGYPTNFTYQSYLNGTSAIPGAASATYTRNNAQLADSGKPLRDHQRPRLCDQQQRLTVIAAPTTGYPLAIMADNPVAFRVSVKPIAEMFNNRQPGCATSLVA